jgi:hypothetical protein
MQYSTDSRKGDLCKKLTEEGKLDALAKERFDVEDCCGAAPNDYQRCEIINFHRLFVREIVRKT